MLRYDLDHVRITLLRISPNWTQDYEEIDRNSTRYAEKVVGKGRSEVCYTSILMNTQAFANEFSVDREMYAKNVDIWMRLKITLHRAHPVLSRRSLREAYGETAAPNTDIPETSTLIAENHAALTMDLTLLNTLLLLARNMLAIKHVAQDLCAAVQFDRQVIKLIVLCVNVTSKGYDGENVDSGTREKLNDVTELCE